MCCNERIYLKYVSVMLFFLILLLTIMSCDLSLLIKSKERTITGTTIIVVYDITTVTTTTTTIQSQHSNSNTIVSLWGLPAITFVNWRPNYHILALSDNGMLLNRSWQTPDNITGDAYSFFKYSEILFYKSEYSSNGILPDTESTVNNDIIFPEDNKNILYKRTTPDNIVSYINNSGDKTVVINLNNPNTDQLILNPGDRIAIISTQISSQKDGTNDLTIVDAIPGEESLQKSVNRSGILDNTSDRALTRFVSYFIYSGETETIYKNDWNNHWFESLTISNETITIKMPRFTSGLEAKDYWDSIDNGCIAPDILFWIVIQH